MYYQYGKVRERDDADFRNFVTLKNHFGFKMVKTKIFHEK